MLSLAFGVLTGACLVWPQEGETVRAKTSAALARIEVPRLRATILALEGMGSRHTAGPGKAKALSWLENEVSACAARSHGRLTWRRESGEVLAQRLGKKIVVTNLIATLRGTSDPDRLYVLGGHFDSINSDNRDSEGNAPGANDDGSGTAAVFEALRVMCEFPFAATIEFCFFDAEEMGLLGSTVHAEALARESLVVDGMITNDIVGNTLGMDGKKRDGYLRCFSYAARGNDSPGRSFARAATWAQRTHVPGLELRLVFRGDRFGRGGDHRPFSNQGWPALRFTEAAEDFSRQHQTVREEGGKRFGDTSEFIDFEYLAKVVAIDIATLCEIASAPRPPSEIEVRGERAAYSTQLTWRGVPGASDYEAVWRATTAPEWEHSKPLRGATQNQRGQFSTVLTDVCIDDVVIGVRSVGPDGARSRAITPPEPDAIDQRPTSRPQGRGR